MGFNLEMMFEELLEILESDKKAAKKCKEIKREVLAAKKYAEECGYI